MPWILTVSPRSLAAGGIEVTERATGERATRPIEEVEAFLTGRAATPAAELARSRSSSGASRRGGAAIGSIAASSTVVPSSAITRSLGSFSSSTSSSDECSVPVSDLGLRSSMRPITNVTPGGMDAEMAISEIR